MAKLALESGAQVIPVAMIDTHKVQPIGRRIPRPGRIGIRIGQPLDFSDRRGQAQDSQVLRQVADEIREAIGQLSGQQYVDVYAPRKR
ncbi:lysophospholipid acyltransferase family protein [Arthrobacter sp. JCM 19049]|uniref:lysophospholipid acyltransferase family protein n=1 Tax=Arthrobacter sp. JCM 19049 TaxID=1460643 RepID=UPI000A49AA1C